MLGERALKVVLVVVGLLFVAAVYPLLMFLWQPHPAEAALTMMLSVYAALGYGPLIHQPGLDDRHRWGRWLHPAVTSVR